MAGSDWDASDEDTASTPLPPASVLPVKKSKFADEDNSDDEPKDDWDASDSDSDSKPAPKPTGPAPPVRAKGITKLKIAEREAAEAAKANELEARRNDTPQERKLREKEAIERADLENAAALLGSSSLSGGGGDDLLSTRCQSLPDFISFSSTLSTRLITTHGSHPLYAKFLESFIKSLSAPLNDTEVRKAASGLTTLANEKQAAVKAGGKKGKGKGAAKPGLGKVGGAGDGGRDTRAYEEALDDDYDDFM